MATPAVLNTTIPAPVLYHGDCMEVMKQFPDNSVDLILNDPPFGCTGNKWDTVLPRWLTGLRRRCDHTQAHRMSSASAGGIAYLCFLSDVPTLNGLPSL